MKHATKLTAASLFLMCAIGLSAQTPTIGVLPDAGPVLPTTCNVGQLYFRTTAATVGLNQCGVVNTWNAIPRIVSVIAPKTETGADATLLSYTPGAAVGTYEVCIMLDVSAANTATLGWTATWTNSKGNANAPTNLSLFQMGVAAPALTFTAAANNSYYACVPISTNNAGTAIVVKTTFAGTSIAYNAAATITRIQ